VAAVAALFADAPCQVLLGSEASEQRLDALAATGRLQDYRVLHLATHGQMDPASAWHSVLLLANDRLPDELTQVRTKAKRYTGQMTVAAVNAWRLDADLVTLSACETGLGQEAGGDGFLGFAQVLFKAGARALLLSLWQVDDDATALLMQRFYQNLLGRRAGLAGPLPRAEALREAKHWLRNLDGREADQLVQGLPGGARTGKTSVPPDKQLKAGRRYEHPYYWAGFILLGDPD
jgi:CHAT domain-containing protein